MERTEDACVRISTVSLSRRKLHGTHARTHTHTYLQIDTGRRGRVFVEGRLACPARCVRWRSAAGQTGQGKKSRGIPATITAVFHAAILFSPASLGSEVDQVGVSAFLAVVAVHESHVANARISTRRHLRRRVGGDRHARIPEDELQPLGEHRLNVFAFP